MLLLLCCSAHFVLLFILHETMSITCDKTSTDSHLNTAYNIIYTSSLTVILLGIIRPTDLLRDVAFFSYLVALLPTLYVRWWGLLALYYIAYL